METEAYWEERYRSGKGSGKGSTGLAVKRKAAAVVHVLKQLGQDPAYVLDMGCGDGAFAKALFNVAGTNGSMTKLNYFGVDISKAAVLLTEKKLSEAGNRNCQVFTLEEWYRRDRFFNFSVSLSFEVVFHILEEELFHQYMDSLFDASDIVMMLTPTDPAALVGKEEHLKYNDVFGWVKKNRDSACIHHIVRPFPGMFSDLLVFRRGSREKIPFLDEEIMRWKAN